MFILGHMGIGSKLASPWSKGLPLQWVFLGTLLPDLIDKPLYYSLSFITGTHGAQLGLISGTRTFGHTALFLMFLVIFAFFKHSRSLAALAIGTMTHLFLDNIVEHFLPPPIDLAHLALLFPLQGVRFPVYPFGGFKDHLLSLTNTVTFAAELLGGGILAWDYWKARHSLLRKKT